jgi:TorA maturation chaperone TorD
MRDAATGDVDACGIDTSYPNTSCLDTGGINTNCIDTSDIDDNQIDEVDAERSREYALLSALLAPDQPLLGRLADLRADASPLGRAHAAVAEAAGRARAGDVQREYFDLFIGLGRGELLPYGSYYLSGFLLDRPLARLRQDLIRLGIERAAGQAEPEDHAAILCEVMAGLLTRRFPVSLVGEREVFERRLSPWIAWFFADLVHAQAADVYRHVGALGRAFMSIETEAFALSS